MGIDHSRQLTWPLIIETDRLMLRPQEPKDFGAWYEGFAGRSPSQSCYDEGRIDLDSYNSDWFFGICERHQEQALRDYAYIFGVFSKATQQHLGNVDLSTIQREEKQWANLGYCIHNQHWRQGFAKEAVNSLLLAGFKDLGYHRIEAAINLDNHASIALAKSVGLEQECVRRGFYYENEQWVDHVIYVGIAEEYVDRR
jgi:[ribosomal protein S5]-alanine N-acetyltransferase